MASKTWDRCVLLNRQMLKTTKPLKSEHVFLLNESTPQPQQGGTLTVCTVTHRPSTTCRLHSDWFIYSLLCSTKTNQAWRWNWEERCFILASFGVADTHLSSLRYENYTHFSCFCLFSRLEWLLFTQLSPVFHPIFILSCSSNPTMLVQINL